MRFLLRILTIAFAFWAVDSWAATLFVDCNGTNPVAPYLDWSTAATNIQDAIDSAVFSDTVLVTNGIYQFGGDSFNGSNRVDIASGITLQSANGPAVTIIKGYQVPGTNNGPSAVRCVYMREFSKLYGFTVTGGATTNSNTVSLTSGGGIATDAQCVISNCVITGNTSFKNGAGVALGDGAVVLNSILSGNTTAAGGMGGGAWGPKSIPSVTLVNCVISNNFSTYGGGVAFCNVLSSLLIGNTNSPAYISSLGNCTVTANYGFVDSCTLNNSIIYFNFSGTYADCYQCKLTNCCTTIGLGASILPNNSFSNAPGFVNPAAGDYHLNPWSSCVDAGTNIAATNSVDLDGNSRIAGAAVDIGAYETQTPFQITSHYVSLLSTNPLAPFTNWSTAATNIQDAVNVAQSGEFVVVGDGLYTNSGTVMFGAETNRVVLTNGITLTSAGGPQKAIIAGATQTRCVYLGSNSTLMGFTVTGGRGRVPGDFTNEESGAGVWCEVGGTVSNCVISFNTSFGSGPLGGGIFRGSVYNSTIYSNNATFGAGGALGYYFNCYFVSNAGLSGNSGGGIYGGTASNCTFLANGTYYGVIGGGAYRSALYNCTLATNSSTYGGGGADSSTLYSCTLIGNQSGTGGGGSRLSTNYNCTFLNNIGSSGGAVNGGVCFGCFLTNNLGLSGGGAYQAFLTNCVLAGNRGTNSSSTGGGANSGKLFNCLIVSNSAANGGGMAFSTLYNCTVIGNAATNNGGGTYGGTIDNSIVYFNSAASGSNYSTGSLLYCCTMPQPNGMPSCFTNDPLFVDLVNGDLHLQSNSPCINSGFNNYITNAVKLSYDLDGNPRIIGSAVDVGAYEFTSPASILPYSWLWQYGLATDGSADAVDSDGDGMNNFAEWRAGTSPTNALSVLALQTPVLTETNATITWSSVSGVQYYLQSTPDFVAQPFQTIATDIAGSDGNTSYTDTNAPAGVMLFYRVGVQ